MGGRLSEALRVRAEPIWAAIFSHPFLRELEEGALPRESFRFYLCQDYHFLAGYARAVGIALAKARDSQTLLLLSRRVIVPAERELHRRLFSLLEMDEGAVEQAELAPTTRAYVNHLIATAALGGVAEAAAAILPCPWTYHEIGARLGEVGQPVYREWATAYKEGILAESVAAWRSLVDGAEGEDPATLARMEEAFLISSRYEFMFWEMAYRGEAWP